MKTFSPLNPVCFISPHLDDIVLSCGYFLFKNPGAAVMTVLAGAPDRFSDQSDWNMRTTGEFYAPDAMKKRRKEDSAAMELLKAKPIYLDGLDLPYLYGQPRNEAELLEKLVAALEKANFKSIIMPVGFHHPDHLTIGSVCRKLTKKISADYYFYLDMPYGMAFPTEAEAQLKQIEKLGRLEELTPLKTIENIKDRAFRLYRSQYEPIKAEFKRGENYDKALKSPEHYWQLHVG